MNEVRQLEEVQSQHSENPVYIPNERQEERKKSNYSYPSSGTQIKECRICLEGEKEGRMMKPCECTGSIQYTHEKCLAQWIKRKQEKGRKAKVRCQMCHQPYNYKVTKDRVYSCDEFLSNYEKNTTNFRLFFAGTTFILLAIIALIVLVSYSSENTEFGLIVQQNIIKTQNVKIIYICVIFLLSLVLMFMLIIFMIEYAIQGQIKIIQLKSFNQPQEIDSHKIHPVIQ